MCINQVDLDKNISTKELLLSENDLKSGEVLIYIQVTRGVAPRTHCFPHVDIQSTVYMAALRFQHPLNERELEVKAILVPDTWWARCDIKSVGLISNVLAR